MRIYEKTYTSINAPLGAGAQLTLGFFSEGFIKKIRVKQVSGVNANFTIDVLNSEKAFDAGADIELYRVFTQAAGTAGTYLSISDDFGTSFKNADGPLSDRKRKIYLLLTPAGSGAATWDISLSGWSDVN